MTRNNELMIDGYSIYIDQLNQLDKNHSTHDSGITNALTWTSNQIKEAMKPAVSILDSLRKAAENLAPDEMEISMQFEVSIKGETPILKIVSAGSAAQMAVKFVWKKENN